MFIHLLYNHSTIAFRTSCSNTSTYNILQSPLDGVLEPEPDVYNLFLVPSLIFYHLLNKHTCPLTVVQEVIAHPDITLGSVGGFKGAAVMTI